MLALTLVNVYSDYKNWKCNHYVHIVQELKNILIQNVKHCIFCVIAHKYPAEHQQQPSLCAGSSHLPMFSFGQILKIKGL